MGLPFLGYGVGLRRAHFDGIFEARDRVDFVEVLVENVMGFGGRPRDVTLRAAKTWPMVLHGVALSIGSVDPLDEAYLERYASLCEATGALWASDHLCFSSAFGVEYHDLVPLPFTDEAVAHVIERTRTVQARLGVPFALENPSYYIAYDASTMSEAEFLREVLVGADCGLLLDVNNVYVNARNHGYDPRAFIDALPLERVVQIHMAGHHDDGTVIIDTHGDHVIPEVLDLYAWTLERTGPVSTLLEWDNDIPPLDVLLAENDAIRAVGERVLGACSG
ncbi:MAG: DUF692 domain-containing protein [Deltaproteobacteria bacterium]|nr:DUF692 domain-containing protein [Deltaproteobacteria bacterium]MCB9786200.1 DUF692 domain-containing protein [Deltaproteobacteria bacterium]